MIELFSWILLAVTGGLFALAAYWDLKTTEFPDWLPYSIIIASLGIRGCISYLSGEWSFLVNSVLIGALFFGLGMGLYYAKQWGDGDAWLLGALGFAFPDAAGFAYLSLVPFPAALLFNFFFIAFFYLLVYSVWLGVRSPEVSRRFLGEIKSEKRGITYMVGGFTVLCFGIVLLASQWFQIPFHMLAYVMLTPLLLLSVLVFMRYGKFVEANLFRRKVPAKNVRAGDVLFKERWRGLTEKEVKLIRKTGKPVWIKEGVRFAPVFLLTILITLFIGNLLMLFI